MLVCFELKKTEAELKTWTIEDVLRWVAFIRLKNEAESKAIEEARKRQGNSGGNSTKTTY